MSSVTSEASKKPEQLPSDSLIGDACSGADHLPCRHAVRKPSLAYRERTFGQSGRERQ